jgi:hypothetical protein
MTRMKKVALGVVLLAIVVGVSYFKSLRHHSQTTTEYERGKQEESEKTIQDRAKLDSLSYFIERQEDSFAQSLGMREMAYRLTCDSLLKIIDSGRTGIDSLKKELDLYQKQAQTKEPVVGATGQKSSRHEQILSYYKKRCHSLPTDLTPYEKKVALAEIREETAQKFSISLQELDNIRSDSKLDY